jgi:GntR family transcriptional regulator
MEPSALQASLLDALAANPLTRVGNVSLHWQCADVLRKVIDELHYPAAVPLPAEKEMAAALNISRPTLRQAMARLSNEGVIHSQRGVGAFALRSGLVRPVGLSSLYRDLQQTGRVPTTRVLVLEPAEADAPVAAALRIAVGAPVTHVERVRYADGVPVVITRTRLSLPAGVELTRGLLESDGLYNLLHRLGGIELVGGTQTVSVRRATADDAVQLEIPSGAPVLVAHRIAFDTLGRGVEYAHIIYPEGTELISDLRGTSLRSAKLKGE